jgi:O-methyltransferase
LHNYPRKTLEIFEGLPPPTENDGSYEREHYYKGWCGGTVEKVEEIFCRLQFPRERLHIIKGWFKDTFPRTVPSIGQIALLHIDADWYDSVKICLETLYPKVSVGGYIVLDDYGTFSGCRKALHEYLDRYHINAELQTREGTGRYFRKP